MNGTGYRTIGLLTVVVATVALSGCNEKVKTDESAAAAAATEPQRPVDEDLPTLEQLQSEVSPVTAPEQQAVLVDRTLTVNKMVYPRDDGRVDVALEALEPVDLPEGKAALWRANGLHVARLPAERLVLWTANLPDPILITGVNILPGLDYGRVSLVGRSSGRTLVHLPGDENETRTERFIGGRYQMLLKLTRRAETPDSILIDLVPHHVSPRDQFRMTSTDDESAGTSFDALRLLTTAPEKEAWLIWSNTQPEATDTPETETNLTPPLLGRAMMTGLRKGKPVRLVLVVFMK